MSSFVNKHLKLIVLICAILNVIVIFIFEPNCLWKEKFNIDCAGCGTTRMFKALFELKFYQAFRYNPFVFCLLILAIIYLIYVVICKIRRIGYYKIQNKDLLILLILVILFMIIRNIAGFEYLKPTEIY